VYKRADEWQAVCVSSALPIVCQVKVRIMAVSRWQFLF